MTVGIQGIKGAFHEEAARKYFNEEISIAERMTFKDVVSSVEKSEADAGLMAIENTVSGTIHSNLELIKASNLRIVGEVVLRIKQNLIVNPGVRIEDIEQVESHYMAINQSRVFLANHPHIKAVNSIDTALSVKHLAESKAMNKGAIGSELAAESYGMEILAASIESDKQNFTRFLVLQNEGTKEQTANKASIHLILSHQVGSLAKVIKAVSNCGVNLVKIESMPILGEPWHYQFYLDVVYEHLDSFSEMTNQIKPYLESLSVLGHYQSNSDFQS